MQVVDSLLIPNASAAARALLSQALSLFPANLLAYAIDHGVRIYPLHAAQSYRDASPALLRLGIDVDSWPVPPAGLFVVEERCIYVRSHSPMTIAHEFGHAIDCALGGGVYFSGIDTSIRAAFAAAKQFVTPYAATGIDEYFAESLRAYVEANDPASPWPRATRERLKRVDHTMFSIVRAILARFTTP